MLNVKLVVHQVNSRLQKGQAICHLFFGYYLKTVESTYGKKKTPLYNISHNDANSYFTESCRWRHCDIRVKLAVRKDKNLGGGAAVEVANACEIRDEED